ncbi:hypothetical protein JOF56_010438 [Kibdelosporangium banguiense]|uniref:Tat pathway signal sequence domain protein n=1 Tax=Kibdelosporangium banguiense TaxID=1365924 RepID=A0ABS4U1E4_9PSEU|nr:bacteriocin fulvocin C-related protein [Kibdelosporangium banguiense]MBP2330053.1 hypothetical protein [Kibdelosporangium banguiense]
MLRALGSLRSPQREQGRGISRAAFLQLTAGVAVAGGLMLGNSPAAAATSNDVDVWIDANRGRLPATYDEVVKHPLEYRQAIFRELSPEQQSKLWVDHLNRYVKKNPELSAGQLTAIGAAIALAGDVATFRDYRDAAVQESVDRLDDELLNEFGKIETAKLVRVLGEMPESTGIRAEDLLKKDFPCLCNVTDDWCSGCPGQKCLGPCAPKPIGCGTLGVKSCNGRCVCP